MCDSSAMHEAHTLQATGDLPGPSPDLQTRSATVCFSSPGTSTARVAPWITMGMHSCSAMLYTRLLQSVSARQRRRQSTLTFSDEGSSSGTAAVSVTPTRHPQSTLVLGVQRMQTRPPGGTLKNEIMQK